MGYHVRHGARRLIVFSLLFVVTQTSIGQAQLYDLLLAQPAPACGLVGWRMEMHFVLREPINTPVFRSCAFLLNGPDTLTLSRALGRTITREEAADDEDGQRVYTEALKNLTADQRIFLELLRGLMKSQVLKAPEPPTSLADCMNNLNFSANPSAAEKACVKRFNEWLGHDAVSDSTLGRIGRLQTRLVKIVTSTDPEERRKLAALTVKLGQRNAQTLSLNDVEAIVGELGSMPYVPYAKDPRQPPFPPIGAPVEKRLFSLAAKFADLEVTARGTVLTILWSGSRAAMVADGEVRTSAGSTKLNDLNLHFCVRDSKGKPHYIQWQNATPLPAQSFGSNSSVPLNNLIAQMSLPDEKTSRCSQVCLVVHRGRDYYVASETPVGSELCDSIGTP
jgi:hypothetical protein